MQTLRIAKEFTIFGRRRLAARSRLDNRERDKLEDVKAAMIIDYLIALNAAHFKCQARHRERGLSPREIGWIFFF